MPLESLLKLLSAAKFPLSATALGLFFSIFGSAALARSIGSTVALVGVGASIASLTAKDKQLAAIRQLQRSHAAKTDALKDSVQKHQADARAAQKNFTAQKGEFKLAVRTIAEKNAAIEILETGKRAALRKADELAQQNAAAVADLSTCHNDNSTLAGELEELQVERMALIYELYETLVTEMNLADTVSTLAKQFGNDTAYQLGQKKRLKSEVTKARADFHTQISDAQNRIAELENALTEKEAALSEKTALATQMLSELEGDANGKFTHFSGKASAQGELINGLKTQIDELRKSNTALTYRRFDTVGTDNIIGNRLIDYLAKQKLVYGALDLSRDGYKGRLKVWLSLIDTTLEKASKSLEDMEAELNLKATPTVEISRGMHLFTLATEPEYEQKAPTMRPPEELIRILKAVNHLRVSAPTDSGKSTLMSNILYLLNGMYQGKQTTTLFDPKYPDSDWPIKPTFNEVEQCVLNAGLVGDTVKARLDEAREAAENGTTAPQHDPHLFVVDEIEFMYSEALAMADMGSELKNTAKTFKRSMKRGLKVGRSRNLKLLYVMQSHLCSDAGFNTADFLQSTNIFLGSNIPMVLATDGELKGRFSEDKRRKLLSEFQTLSAKGEKYIMLVVTANSREAFIMIPPKPNYFAEKDGVDSDAQNVPATDGDRPETSATEKPKCKYCESENVTYRRQKGGKKQYTCDEPDGLCSYKTFTI